MRFTASVVRNKPMTNSVTPEQRFELGKHLAERLGRIDADKDEVQNAIESGSHPFWSEVDKHFAPKQSVVAEPVIMVPNLRQTGPTLADWLKAREELHKFFTGESIVLRDVFAFSDEQLVRTDLIPVFRPVGATNRMAINWKKKLEVQVYEEVDVMKFKNSAGPKTPEMYLINRSVKPDRDTLGKNAKSPDQLIVVPNKIWLGLYGWADADTLHFAVTGDHFDPETVTWFPNDRLPGGRVARGSWGGTRVCFLWRYRDSCYSYYGARVAVPVPSRS